MGAVWGSLAALSIGLSDLFGRRVVQAASALTAAFIMQVVGSVTALVSVLFFASEYRTVDMAWGALSGLGMGVGLATYFTALRRSSATVAAPTVATLAAVIPFAYTMFRGEELSRLALVGAGVAFVGLAVIAAGNGDRVGLRQGLMWGTTSGVCYGLGVSALVEVSNDAGVWPAVSQRLAGVAILGVAALVSGSALVPPKGLRLTGFGAGVAAGLSTVFALIGFTVDALPTVITQSMFPVVSVVVGFFYFGDSVARRQIVGIALVLTGVIAVVTT